jgi:hypothetical protein
VSDVSIGPKERTEGDRERYEEPIIRWKGCNNSVYGKGQLRKREVKCQIYLQSRSVPPDDASCSP